MSFVDFSLELISLLPLVLCPTRYKNKDQSLLTGIGTYLVQARLENWEQVFPLSCSCIAAGYCNHPCCIFDATVEQ